MKRVIDISETLGRVETPEGDRELCVTADAQYDDSGGHLVIGLASFLRNLDLVTAERHSRAAWLPRDQTLREHVGPEEAGDLAREIFHRWVRRVRESAPALHPI